jgi:hypothetical protein
MPDSRGRRARDAHALAIRDTTHRGAPAPTRGPTGPSSPTPVSPSDVPRVPRPALRLVKDDHPTGG